jgi:hypothetical protein
MFGYQAGLLGRRARDKIDPIQLRKTSPPPSARALIAQSPPRDLAAAKPRQR